MSIFIREAMEEDVNGLAVLSVQLGYTMSADTTLENLRAIRKNNYEKIFVAIKEKQLIGWVHVFETVRLESGPFCEIGGLVVHEQWQHKGIGSKLVDRVKQWTLDIGKSKLKVRCNIKRDPAHRFYRQMGFIENKVQTVFEWTLI